MTNAVVNSDKKSLNWVALKVAHFCLQYGALILVVLLVLGIALVSPDFLTPGNLINVLVQNAAIGIVALGMTFVIIVQGIDISVGGNIALASLLASIAMSSFHLPWYVGILIFLIMSTLVGWINGFSVSKLGMTPFLVTLATLTVTRGLVLAIGNGQSVYGLPPEIKFLGSGRLGPVPVPIVIMLLAFLVGHILLSRSVFGRQVLAIGGNADAARMQGLNVNRTRTLAYVVCGAFVSLAAIVLAGRYNAAMPDMAEGFEFSAIAMAVIGGTSMAGGEGSAMGTFVGVLVIGLINNALNLLGVSVFYQGVARGAVIFFAILLDTLRRHLAESEK